MSVLFPDHPARDDLEVAGGVLSIGGSPVTEIVERCGRTPLYVYDGKLMLRRVRALRAVLPEEVELHYAMKANPMPAVVDLLAAEVDGLDVASGAELKVALASGTAPRDISFAGPGKSDAELADAVAAGIVINLESEREMARVAKLAQSQQRKAAVAVRVNPAFELKSSGMKMGGGPKPFGVDSERVPAMLQAMRDLPLEFAGFHIFSGSQNLRAESIIEAQTQALGLACELAAAAPAPPRIVNLGGGLGIPYFPGEKPLDPAPIGANLRTLVARAARELPGARLVIELGRYLVGEAGFYVCRIVDRKISRGHVFLVTDGGLHHHLAASGNFGQVIRRNYPVLIGNKADQPPAETASVVGPLCTPLDLLAERAKLPQADVGDLVVVCQSGAYGLTASPLGFLSHPHPLEILV
jgi:diaminopimelate decarboxylase